MKLILKASVTHLGEPGDLVEVKKGYARNYLIPKGMAVRATSSNLKAIEHEIDKLKAAAAEQRAAAEAIARQIAKLTLEYRRKVAAADTGSLYGSVSVADIGDSLEAEGFQVDKGEIHLEHTIKHLGDYEVEMSLAHGVQATVKVRVLGEDGEEAAPPPEVAAAPEELAELAEITQADETPAEAPTTAPVETAVADADPTS